MRELGPGFSGAKAVFLLVSGVLKICPQAFASLSAVNLSHPARDLPHSYLVRPLPSTVPVTMSTPIGTSSLGTSDWWWLVGLPCKKH